MFRLCHQLVPIDSETQIVPSAQNPPNFLDREGYKEPRDPLRTNYMALTPERLGIFERMSKNPQLSKRIAGYSAGVCGVQAGLD